MSQIQTLSQISSNIQSDNTADLSRDETSLGQYSRSGTTPQNVSNDQQPILMISVKSISSREMEKLARIPDLRIFEVSKLSKNLDITTLKDKFDLILLNAFDETCFQLLRENYKNWQNEFNLTLYQRSGFSSDPQFVQYFENICKKLPLDAMNREQFMKGCNAQPYLKRPQKWWKVVLKKVFSYVLRI
jgi:hypothetical protein